MPNWDKFPRSRASRRRDGSPTITIGKQGEFRLYHDAYALIGQPSYVTLHWAENTGTVGIAPSAPDDPDSYKVGKYSKNSFRVSSGRFCAYYGIALRPAVLKAYEREGMLCFDVPSHVPKVPKLHRSTG